MHRRQITKGLIAAGLAAPALLTAFPGRARQRDIQQALKRLTVYVEDEGTEIDRLIVLNKPRVLGLSLRGQLPVFNEDRNPSGIPALGGNLRPTLDERVANSVPVGDVYLGGSSLVVQPLVSNILNVTKVIVGHQDETYEPPGRLRRVTLNRIPLLGEMFKLGQARREKNHLYIFVTPIIVDLDD